MSFKQLLFSVLSLAAFLLPTVATGHIDPRNARPNTPTRGEQQQIEFRNNCDNAQAEIDMQINNVRARLTTGGDVWWDGNDGRYIVPKPPPDIPEVSSIFAGAVWLGGRDPGGGLKVAAQQYGRSQGNFDYYAGPLTEDGTTSRDTCAQWDRFFTVSGESIRTTRRLYQEALESGQGQVDEALIPEDVLGWPGVGNPYFFGINEFELPTGEQGLAGFWDEDEDGIYDPTFGDYPIIEIRGCSETPQFPEEMSFWIYNDAGNIHRESQTPNLIRMEIQVQAFAYTTADDINNMTFQRYKLINRAPEDILDTYFAMWVDPDLGCFTDDYVGCDTTRSLAYVYNEDELDGTNGCTCDQAVNTYCDEVPILGVDYFRGPRMPIFDEDGFPIDEVELGMSSFIYMNNGGVGTPDPATTDPQTDREYYRLLQGRWRDDSPLCNAGDGYAEPGCAETRYVFPDAPNDINGFSMVTSELPFGDRRTLQASGPFTLLPGAVNELIIGVVWVGNQTYPNPSIRRLQGADDLAQNLFDSCFDICDGPDAPDVDVLELDQEIVLLLSNPPNSNNFNEEYTELGLTIPEFTETPDGEVIRADSLYRFEGYRVFQFARAGLDLSSIGNPDEVREIARFDMVNGVTDVFNWTDINEDDNPLSTPFLAPELIVAGSDNGISRSLRITQDAFASGGNTNLINHKRYYFTVIAYGYNNYKDYDPFDFDNPGQAQQYKASSRNIGDRMAGTPYYTVIPRPILDQEIRAEYGEGIQITRLAGSGNQGNFLDLTDESEAAVEAYVAEGGTSDFTEPLTYEVGASPIEVFISNPLTVRDGDYEIKFFDDDNEDDELNISEARWMLRCTDGCSVPAFISQRPITQLSEELVGEFGFSVLIGNPEEPGEGDRERNTNGAVGATLTYADPDGDRWLSFITDQFSPGTGRATIDLTLYDYISTDFEEQFENLDPEQVYSDLLPGIYPFRLFGYQDIPEFGRITPNWILPNSTPIESYSDFELGGLNNVDIVLTSDKSLWTKAPVIETANYFYAETQIDGQNIAAGLPNMFDLRADSSVSRQAVAGNDSIAMLDPDAEGRFATGMGWFPGYAVDVETGQRLALYFGENSLYGEGPNETDANGDDMIWNPTSQVVAPLRQGRVNNLVYNFPSGGQHYFYVTSLPYDEGEFLHTRLRRARTTRNKEDAITATTWVGFPLLTPGTDLLSYAEGVIPNDVKISLRVNNEFGYDEGATGEGEGNPTYQFSIGDRMAVTELDEVGIERALDGIAVVPNPYYGFSDYEDDVFNPDIKITNLPAQATVTIYSLDGKFIRKYNRDEAVTELRGSNRPFGQRQITPALSWDLRNFRGIPVSSGVYLIHVSAPGLGERTLKFFGIQREFDPSGL